MPTQLVIRLCRRRTSWERTDPREIAEIEFPGEAEGSLANRPSVYVIVANESELRSLVVRVRAEHSASGMYPPAGVGTIEFNVEGATSAPRQQTPGTTLFPFANSIHAELLMRSEDEVIALVGKLLAEKNTRSISITGAEILGYVDGRRRAGDPEWAVVGPHHQKWAEALARFNRAPKG